MAHDKDPAYVLAAGATFLAVCIIIVVLRFFTRTLQKVTIGIDDWLVIPALVCASLIPFVRLCVWLVDLLIILSSW